MLDFMVDLILFAKKDMRRILSAQCAKVIRNLICPIINIRSVRAISGTLNYG